MNEPPPSRPCRQKRLPHQFLRFHICRATRLACVLLFLTSSLPAWCQSGTEGLAVFVDGGALFSSDIHANFYNGAPSNDNNIQRVLNSEAYGLEIWQNLRNQGYLYDVSNYSGMTISESKYPIMDFRPTYQIGLGIRYGFKNEWGWMFRVGYARLTALGAFNIDNVIPTSILTNQDRYITCGILGEESRINLDLGLYKLFPLGEKLHLEIACGFNLNNTKVLANEIEVGGKTYNILNVWGSSELYAGVGSYDYINQGAIGIGGFASFAVGYALPNVGSIDIGYHCYYNQTHYIDYNDDNPYLFQHSIFLRASIYNFSFWD